MPKYRIPPALLLAALFATPLYGQSKPRLMPEDYGKWENLGGAQFSPDGQWFVAQISRVDMDGEIQVYRSSGGDPTVVANGTNPAFSRDGRWLAYSIVVGEKEREQLEKQKKPVRSQLGILNLASGQQTTIPEIASFAFSGDGRFIAMRGYTPEGSEARGVAVLVRNLADGSDVHFGNVAEYAWQDEGALLALAIDAETKIGNAIQLFDPATGVTRTLTSDTTTFRGLQWRKKSADLAALKLQKNDDYEGDSHVVLAWTGLNSRAPKAHTFDAATHTGVPADTRIVDFRDVSWSDDGATVFFGVQDWERKPAKEEADSAAPASNEKPVVEVWHAKDIDIIPTQKVRAERDRRANRLSAWHLAGDRFVALDDGIFESISLFEGQKMAYGTDRTPYDEHGMFGAYLDDLYVIDVNTGERTKVKEGVEFKYGPSPGGRYLLYLENDHYFTYDVRRGTHTNITEKAPVSFINHEDDHTVQQKPPHGVGMWTENDRSVLIYDKYDIWELAPDGSRQTRLTNGAEEQVRHRLVFLDPDNRKADLSKPTYVALYGDRTKKFGYGRLHRGQAEKLVWLDKNVGRLTKAKNADRFAWVVQGFDDSPDWFAGDASLASGVQLTSTNPFQADYAWGRSELIDYRNTHGVDLQGALYYPANYEPGRKYPMLVYFYEITSNTLHSYQSPSERAYYNPTVWTQEGYFVLRPDIVYRDRNPGLSAVEALLPAVEAALSHAPIDTAKVGLIGHSWGGYQTAFVPTQTDMFAAAVAGAPLTDLYSMYLSVYWNTGGTDARIFEVSQGRMEVPPWQDLDSYLANSPVHHIEKLNTPMLMMFGTEDGAVDWDQGTIMYNAARRAAKDFVLLAYEGENHGLAKKPNQIDYHRRILEWFGHYLKGEEAAPWIREGVRFLDRDGEKRPNRIAPRPIS
jgi:dipeptidyl aminopeptidase/acylaminoacyl peptidase